MWRRSSATWIDAALPFEPAGVLVQQAGKGRIYLNMMNGEIPEFRDILFMTLATHPDNLKDKPELLRKVAQVFTEATRILKTEPERAKALLAKEYPSMTAETNEQAFATVSQIWPLTGHMTEQQARATFDYLQPEGPHPIDFPRLSPTYSCRVSGRNTLASAAEPPEAFISLGGARVSSALVPAPCGSQIRRPESRTTAGGQARSDGCCSQAHLSARPASAARS